MQKVAKTIYETIMILLVMLTIVTIWTNDTYNTTISWIVWGVFFLDFMVRFMTAEVKWTFIKQNPFLFIAIIPFDQFFQMARIVRIIYLFRIKTIAKYYVVPFVEKLTIRSKSLILLFVLASLFAEMVLILAVEPSIESHLEASLAVLGYLLFFGHRVFEIEQAVSVWTLTAVSVLGIAMQGLALQWVFHRADLLFHRFKDKHAHVAEREEQPEFKANGK